MKIFSLLKTQKLMLVKSIITEKCFANQIRRDSAHYIVSVIHLIWQASLNEGSQCVYIYTNICVCVFVCVAQLMLAESFYVVNHDINSEIKVC